MRKKYENPPIVEALCEFRFKENPWNILYSGYIYEECKTDYPNINSFAIPILHPDGGLLVENRIQFSKENEEGIIQITDSLLSIHKLKIYKTWEDFFFKIKKIFQMYNNIVKPKQITRIGLRYVNKINLDNEAINLKDYFEYYPFMGNNLPKKFKQFNINTIISYENEKDFLKLVQMTIPSEKQEKVSIMLDLDYFSNRLENNIINIEEIFSWIDKAHENLEGAFEGCITDKLREVFNEVKG